MTSGELDVIAFQWSYNVEHLRYADGAWQPMTVLSGVVPDLQTPALASLHNGTEELCVTDPSILRSACGSYLP